MKSAEKTTWEDLKKTALARLLTEGLSREYHDKLKFEISEIDKQGANLYWIDLYSSNRKFNSNPNGLLFPWALGMLTEDRLPIDLSGHLNTAKAADVAKYVKEHGSLPLGFVKDPDMPDIDLDCLPKARDPIKVYAMKNYGQNIDDEYGPVCSVATWQTYKFRSAIIDICAATGLVDKPVAYELTTKLPDEVDDLKENGEAICKGSILNSNGEAKECGYKHHLTKCPKCGSADTDGPTIGKLIQDNENLKEFTLNHKEVIAYAIRIIGRIRNMGMHAGALIIADRSLYGSIPLAKTSENGYWLSMWSEGRNTQLSKFGFVKWDILGLKTLQYIFNCCKLIEQNRGIRFGELAGDGISPAMDGWDDIDPRENKAGHFFDPHGNKHIIELNDPHALKLADEQKTDGTFQFDTPLAKSILSNGVRSFEDLMLFNAMGHPGPMQSIPEAVENRDSRSETWKRKLQETHPAIYDVLKDTYGVICFQEQLQSIWQRVAGFTAPEAQEARKAVAKKWTHKLKPIKEKWIEGASQKIGYEEAEYWWGKMETFGRYAFNRSHAVSYCLVAYKCLWLKAHFAPEWWASVMSDCHPDKLVRYMGIARTEGWKPTHITRLGNVKCDDVKTVTFDTLNINNLTSKFTVTDNVVNQGMIGIKGIGENAAVQFEGRGSFVHLDEFIDSKGVKNKSVLERFIKLGAFKHVPNHENSKALWIYYQYKYCSSKEVTILRKQIRNQLLIAEGWDDAAIQKERERQINEYRKTFPNRRKIPDKFYNWKPKPDDNFENIMKLCQEDFALEEVLAFEKEYLGYYLHSPLDLYSIEGDCNIEAAKNDGEEDSKIEVIVTNLEFRESKNGKPYCRMEVSDGIQSALVLIWSKELSLQQAENIAPGTGVQMFVNFDKQRGTFTLCRNEIILRLIPRAR
jgi:DNA polymerase III alpha subunit